MKSVALVLGLAFSAAAYHGIALANQYEDQVKTRLAAGALVCSLGGYEVTSTHIDTLRRNGRDTLSLTLRSRSNYKIIGACDDDCTDLDLILYDENDREVARDEKTDDVPIVDVSPRWDADFTLRVHLYACKTEKCVYGVLLCKR